MGEKGIGGRGVISDVILGLVFFSIVWPLGLLARLLGQDVLRLRRDPDADSYWIRREPPGPDQASYRRQL